MQVQQRTTTDADGTWEETVTVDDEGAATLVSRVLRQPSAAYVAKLNEADPVRERSTNNRTRIEALGRQAARFAKDPATNAGDCFLPSVLAGATAPQRAELRKLHELIARLALASTADDV